MTKDLNIQVDQKLRDKTYIFKDKMNSAMYYRSELNNDSMSFDWLKEIEFACPYIDNIVRNPKLFLIKQNEVVKIEKAKKITVESVKDLSKHTHYIEKIDKKTNEVQPSKILISRQEETFNIYENRFLFTLLDNLIRFVSKKEILIESIDVKNSKTLEYAASTTTGGERVNVELKVSSGEIPKGSDGNDFAKELENIKQRMKRVKDYISGWRRSEFYKSLDRAHIAFVTSPIRKTNTILKNPNFQIAMKLWSYIQAYNDKADDNASNSLDTEGNEILKGILDDAFLMNYYVLDSISSSKKEQKEKIMKYAVLMISGQVQRAVSLLLNNGIEITDEEILKLISSEIKDEKDRRLVGSADVKKKFKSAMDEYLERTKDYL